MRKPKVIFFSTGIYEKQVKHYLLDRIDIESFPMDYVLGKKDIVRDCTVVILWFDTRNICAKIRQIRSNHPDLPIFLIIDDPTKEDLLFAIKHRITNVFTLPMERELLKQAIYGVVKCNTGWKALAAPVWRQARKMLQGHRFGFWPSPADEYALQLVPPPYNFLFDAKVEAGQMYDLHINFFDNLRIYNGNGELPKIKGRKNQSLLAYLLYHHRRPIPRDKLMELFWGDVAPSSARNSLNVAISTLRKNLDVLLAGRNTIIYENECYSINPELAILTDVEQFNYFWDKGKAIESSQGLEHALGAYDRALALYQNDFMQHMLYEEWCEGERDILKETYLFILSRLSVFYFESKRYDPCINIGKKMLQKDKCLEEVHRKLIECYHALGLNDLAIRQYRKCEEILRKELDVQPSKQTRELLRKIKN